MALTMTDLHCHLIPGVDDGATDPEMALIMLRDAADQGVTCFFATSHSSAYDQDPQGTRLAYEKLVAQARCWLPQVRLRLGCEVLCEPTRMEQTLRALAEGRYPTMNGTKFVLAEFSQWVRRDSALVCLQALCRAGWLPIIAHAERYPYLQGDVEFVNMARGMGCRIQVNAYSLRDEADQGIRGWARRLILEGMADFLGSDLHRTWHRPPQVARGLQWLQAHCPERAEYIAWGNAARLLEGEV